ncbi:MAG: hypothetical protein WC314_14555 [Vulcanimicrobiota bacterium]
MAGCSTKMESEHAQTIKIIFPEGEGQVGGTIKTNNPASSGVGQQNFDITLPGEFEIRGGPSAYEIVFNALPKDLKRSWKITVDGRELKRGPDMIVEEDRGPRVSFTVGAKTPSP